MIPASASVRDGASQIIAWPAASISTQTSATLAPPILSGRWPKKIRPSMKATLKLVKGSQAGDQPRWAKSSAMNVTIAPKPTPLSAKPRPGTHTAPATSAKAARALRVDATARNDATSGRVTSGINIVASAIAAKPSAA